MARIENITRFATAHAYGFDQDGRQIMILCVAGTFELPPAGKDTSVVPVRTEEQPPPPLVDLWSGKPGASSLRQEGQTAFHRPGTDVYIIAQAFAPHGQPTRETLVRVRVGPCSKELSVSGDRFWKRGLLGLRPTAPEPFVSMPLVYELAYGGVAEPKKGKEARYDPRNPVGKGFYASAREAVGRPLPNIEDPRQRVARWSHRVDPAGVGPIARNWQPRLRLAGTYDADWVEKRAPLWPTDFDIRFFQAASPGLTASPWLSGGEPVHLEGMDPAGSIGFTLPKYRLGVASVFRGQVDRRALILDGVEIDVEARRLTLAWRAAVPVERKLAGHEYSVVREVEEGEVFVR